MSEREVYSESTWFVINKKTAVWRLSCLQITELGVGQTHYRDGQNSF